MIFSTNRPRALATPGTPGPAVPGRTSGMTAADGPVAGSAVCAAGGRAICAAAPVTADAAAGAAAVAAALWVAGSAAVRGDWPVPARTAAIWATVPCPAGWAGAARSGSAPAANRAAVHAPGSCPDAGTLVTGRPEQAAAAARASSGAASISRSAPSATTARASRNRTGVVS